MCKIIWPVNQSYAYVYKGYLANGCVRNGKFYETEVAINLWKPYVYKFPKSLAWLRLGLCPEMALVSTPLKLVGRFGFFLTTSSLYLCKNT